MFSHVDKPLFVFRAQIVHSIKSFDVDRLVGPEHGRVEHFLESNCAVVIKLDHKDSSSTKFATANIGTLVP